jgi:hypothetical protein
MIGRKVCLWLSGPIATVIAVAETAAGPVYTVQFADGSTTRWAARHVMEPELHLEGRPNDRNQPHPAVRYAGRPATGAGLAERRPEMGRLPLHPGKPGNRAWRRDASGKMVPDPSKAATSMRTIAG